MCDNATITSLTYSQYNTYLYNAKGVCAVTTQTDVGKPFTIILHHCDKCAVVYGTLGILFDHSLSLSCTQQCSKYAQL